MSNIEIKKKVIGLRQEGHSINEISNCLPISKSTISLWVKDIELSKIARERINGNRLAGIKRSNETNKRKKLDREKTIVNNCNVVFKKRELSDVEAKIYLSMLYWGEGSKTGNRVEFMNSDHKLIMSFIGLLRKGFKVNEKKLRGIIHLHSYHDINEMVDYWSKCTKIDKDKISIYQKKESGITKKEGYKGCFSLRYGDVGTLQEILLIIERFTKIDYN